MTTYPHPHRIHAHRPHVNLSLIAIGVLAAALIGLGAWVAVDRLTGGGGATHDATALIDKEYAYVSAGNVNAATALFTPDAIIWQTGATAAKGTAQIRTLIASAKPSGFTATRIAPVTVQGQFATTFFSTPLLSNPVLGVFQLRDGKIFREWDFELGRNTPFNTAKP